MHFAYIYVLFLDVVADEVEALFDVRARLLTRVQVRYCWNYALEAIINIVIIIIPVSR